MDRGKVLGLVFADLKTFFTISPQSITEKRVVFRYSTRIIFGKTDDPFPWSKRIGGLGSNP